MLLAGFQNQKLPPTYHQPTNLRLRTTRATAAPGTASSAHNTTTNTTTHTIISTQHNHKHNHTHHGRRTNVLHSRNGFVVLDRVLVAPGGRYHRHRIRSRNAPRKLFEQSQEKNFTQGAFLLPLFQPLLPFPPLPLLLFPPLPLFQPLFPFSTGTVVDRPSLN